MAEGVTVANAFVQVMPSMEGATSNITNALVPSLGSAGDQAGAKFGTVFAGKAGAVLKTAGVALAGVFAVGAMKDAYETVEAGFNKVKLATGATGEEAEKLKSVYLEVSKSVSGSFEDIGAAVGELNTRFDLQGEELEKASEQAMKYAKVTGQDATSAIKDVSRLMNNAGISADEYSRVLDLLTRASQKSGVDVSKLTTIVTDNAASFKELGFSTEESIAMLSQFEKSGANTSAILTGMKKGIAAWSKEGKSAKEGFQEFVEGVQSGTVTSADAIEMFGSKAGISMYDAAQKGQLSFDDMYTAITEGSEGALDSIYQDTLTAQEKFDILGKNLQAGFFTILEPIVDALMPYVDMAIQSLTELINGAVTAIQPFVDSFAAFIQPIIDSVLPELQSVFDTVMTGIGEIVATVWPDIEETITEVMNALQPLLESAWPAIKAIIETVMIGIRTIIQTVWPIVSSIIKSSTENIKTAVRALQPLLEFVTSLFNGIKMAIQDPINTAKSVVENVMNRIKGIINGLKLQLPSIALPHFWVSGGEFPFGIAGMGWPPEFGVDWYAKGGFANEPTLNGYGEKGLELYWPGYDPYFDMYAKGIAEHMPTNGVDIHDCSFYVREESDIRKVAEQLNVLINRQSAGAFA